MNIRDEIDTVIFEMCEKIKQKLQTGNRKDLEDALDLTDAVIDLVETKSGSREDWEIVWKD